MVIGQLSDEEFYSMKRLLLTTFVAALTIGMVSTVPTQAAAAGHCHVKCSDFNRLFGVACRDANHLLHTPSLST